MMKILAAFSLVATTVAVHAAGLAIILRQIVGWKVRPDSGFWPVTWRIILTAWQLILVHLLEITMWGLFYWWQRCLPDVGSSLYFAGVTYKTVGYGDLVLPQEWRLFGPVEGLAGILMCGLSTGFFFAMVSRLYEARRGCTDG
jgi:hypothetical protein